MTRQNLDVTLVKNLYIMDNCKMDNCIRRTVFNVLMDNIYQKLPHTTDTVKKLIACRVKVSGYNQIAARFVIVKKDKYFEEYLHFY